MIPAWIEDGLCAGAGDTLDHVLFPGDGITRRIAAREAKPLCGKCPVRADCLAYGLEHKLDGVWGGQLNPRRPKPSDLKPRPAPKTHGTHSGYANGCKCDPCREAHRIYSVESRAKLKARRAAAKAAA